MRALSLNISKTISDQELGKIKDLAPNLMFMFFSSNLEESKPLIDEIGSRFSDVAVIGCSTAGEISNDRINDDSLTLLALRLEKTEVRTTGSTIESSSDSYEAAKRIGQKLNDDKLKAVFVLSPGVQVNGSDVVRGIESAVGKGITVFGGLAGDGAAFQKTYTILNGRLDSKELVAVGFYGDSFMVKTGSEGGWAPFGPARRITRSDNNVLFELDGKPALELYETYLGDKAKDLPASGLLYPFALLNEDHSPIGMIRTILDIDRDAKSLILAGDIPKNKMVRLMHADTDELISGAEKAAAEARIGNPDNAAAILVSCVGRKIVMAEDVAEEIETVKEILGENTAVAGFYSYGEICPVAGTGKTELHNQTMTIAHFYED